MHKTPWIWAATLLGATLGMNGASVILSQVRQY